MFKCQNWRRKKAVAQKQGNKRKFMFNGIFWDNDGVLMETEHLYFRACAEALEGEGVALSMDEFMEISMRRGESVLQLARLPRSGESALRDWRNERYLELLANEAQVIPGVVETLQRLHGRVPMAIVTGCRREHFELMHRGSGLLRFFDFVVTREDYLRAKPHPESYLTALKRAALHPQGCLAVEDSERGVAAAVAAGLACAAIPGGFNAGGNFAAARWRLERISQLPELLGLDGSLS